MIYTSTHSVRYLKLGDFTDITLTLFLSKLVRGIESIQISIHIYERKSVLPVTVKEP